MLNKSENATLQYFILSEKVLDEKYLLKIIMFSRHPARDSWKLHQFVSFDVWVMFLIVFNALFTEFCNGECAKRLLCLSAFIILVLHYYKRKLFYHLKQAQKSISNLSKKKIKKRKMFPFDKNNYGILYKYYVPWLGDSRKYHPEECDYHISRDDIFGYHPIRECNIYFIVPNIRSFIFYALGLPWWGEFQRENDAQLLIYMQEWKSIFHKNGSFK